MAMTLEQISLEVLGLPTKHRALLAEKILQSLDHETEPNVKKLWQEEVDRRWREIQDGAVTCIPAEEVMREAYASLK